MQTDPDNIDNLLDIAQLVTTAEVVLFVLFIIFCSYFFSRTISYKSIKSRSFIILSIFPRGVLMWRKTHGKVRASVKRDLT